MHDAGFGVTTDGADEAPPNGEPPTAPARPDVPAAPDVPATLPAVPVESSGRAAPQPSTATPTTEISA
jgi:hypothetical protein